MEYNGINISSQGTTGFQGISVQGSQGIARFSGIHNALPTVSGTVISYQISMAGAQISPILPNVLYAIPFIPAKNTTYRALSIAVQSAGSTGLGRILVYDDFNGKPNRKIFESTNVDLNTNGIKLINTTGTFLAGVTYWLCWYCSENTSTFMVNNSNQSSCLTVDYDENLIGQLGYYMNVTFGSAPNTFSTSPILFSGVSPHFPILIFITIA